MLKPALQLRLGQQLTMTPQLQQAIRLLQLPVLELQAQIREALEANVMLEAEEEDTVLESLGATEDPPLYDGDPVAEETTATPSHEAQDEHVEIIADGDWSESHTVGIADSPWNNDDDGYLVEPLDEIALNLMPELTVQPDEVEEILKVVQSFDPAGVGARSVGECIELQLRQLVPETLGLETAITIAQHYLDEVAGHQYTLLRRQLHTTEEDLDQALALVRSCQPRPGATIHTSAPDYIVPDVFIRRTEQGWAVEINPASVPRVRVNQSYAGML